MPVDHWDRIRELFDEVSRHPPDQRRRVLDELCPDEPDLRAEVLSLIEHDERAEPAFLAPPCLPPYQGGIEGGGLPLWQGGAEGHGLPQYQGGIEGDCLPPWQGGTQGGRPDALVGTQIGKYQINRVIAAGGMGTVYEAEQENPHRTVAVKVMHAWAWSQTTRRRFEFEVEALARLTHPNIAQIYDAGTWERNAETGKAESRNAEIKEGSEARRQEGNEGNAESRNAEIREAVGRALPADQLPYFVMEFVPEARTITDFAAQQQLNNRQRLELFLQACDAVHYGHQKGIIHRDLKPANILVGGELPIANFQLPNEEQKGPPPIDNRQSTIGNPSLKVIDFGVARATDSDVAATTMHTDAGQLIGTLQYMSPEQCAADPLALDVRSDVYALGVVLYELLCGQLPYGPHQYRDRYGAGRDGNAETRKRRNAEIREGNKAARQQGNEGMPSDQSVERKRHENGLPIADCQMPIDPNPERERRADQSVERERPDSLPPLQGGIQGGTSSNFELRSSNFSVPGTAYSWIKAICEEPPARPRTIDRRLRGDLELILLKALEKDRAKRYQSVADLARDIRHYLNREPIEARGPTIIGSIHTWVRKHPAWTTGLTAALLGSSVLTGFFVSGWLAYRRPYRYEIRNNEREVALLSYSGNVLSSWAEPANGSFRTAQIIQTGLDTPRRLGIIGHASGSKSELSGKLSAFDIDAGSFTTPVWQDYIKPSDVPALASERHRLFNAIDFGAEQIFGPFDTFPSVPGNEIVVTYFHSRSRRAIRIVSVTGEPLWQVWVDGVVTDVRWLPETHLLVVSGSNAMVPWTERGQSPTKGDHFHPWVVWAVHPELRMVYSRYICTENERECLPPAWYKCLLPSNSTDTFVNIRLGPAEPSQDSGSRFLLVLDYQLQPTPISAGWLMDANGLVTGLYTTDAYLQMADKLPKIEDFRLDKLPAITSRPSSGTDTPHQ